MLMPMVWTNDFDDFFDDDWFDPFDDVVALAPTKDEVETAKSIDRHDRKEARKYYNGLRHGFNRLNNELTRAMKADVIESKDGNYVVKADLPGFDKKDINIGLKNGILTVSASHSENNDEKDEKTGKYLRRERTSSSYQRAFNVGEDVKPEEISAKYENGVLTLTVPNKNAALEQKQDDTKQIEVH